MMTQVYRYKGVDPEEDDLDVNGAVPDTNLSTY